MPKNLTISDKLYIRLEATAQMHNFRTVEQLLENWQAIEEDRVQEEKISRQIDHFRDELLRKMTPELENA